MAVSIYTVCEGLITTLAADAAITAYCTALGWQAPRFFLGINQDELPKDDKVPWIGVMPAGAGINEAWNNYDHEIRLCVVTLDKRVSESGVITKFVGYQSIEGLSDLVHRAVWADLEDTTSGYTNRTVDNYRIECVWPYYRATWVDRIATAT
jgi:hypothetical protein